MTEPLVPGSVRQSGDQSAPEHSGGAERSARATSAALVVSLLFVALVWIAGCVWSFEEQSGFAALKGFRIPWLLPLVLDGLAFSLAAVAFAASLDGRPALFARGATIAAIASSATSNGAFAWIRSDGDYGTVTIAAGIPIAANLAFEVILAESRRQVLRRRGVPAPVKIPYPSPLRTFLAPFSTFAQWRREVLAATDLTPLFEAARSAAKAAPSRRRIAPTAPPSTPATTPAPERSAPPEPEPMALRKSVPPRRSTPGAPLHLVGVEHSRTASADASALRDRYGDALPERGAHALVQREMGWGGQKATNAIKAYRAGHGRAERSADAADDSERVPVGVSA